MVFDDFPWDDIGKGYCPNKKALLTGNENITVSIHLFPTDEQFNPIHWTFYAALGP